MQAYDAFDLKYTSKEVTAWGGLALLKRMMDGLGLHEAIQSWDLPAPGSNRGYAPVQLIEQMMEWDPRPTSQRKSVPIKSVSGV